MFPVRCYTCNSVVAAHFSDYSRSRLEGEETIHFFKRNGIERMCCRRMFLGHVEVMDDLVRYPNVDVVLDDAGTILSRRVRMGRTVGCD